MLNCSRTPKTPRTPVPTSSAANVQGSAAIHLLAPAVNSETQVPEATSETDESVGDSSFEEYLAHPKLRPQSTPPWGRFVLLWIMCGSTSGLMQGQTLFVNLFAEAGIYRNMCSGEARCKQQYVVLTNMFQIGTVLSFAYVAPIGIGFDRWGGRVCGMLGAAVCGLGLFLTWFGLEGSAGDDDLRTSICLFVGLLTADLGSQLNSYAIMSLLWHFPGRQALVLSLIQGTYQMSAFLPVLFQMITYWTGLQIRHLMLGWTFLVWAFVYPIWILTPSQQEYYDEAERVLGVPLPRSPKEVRVIEMSSRAWDVLRLHIHDHVCSITAFSLGLTFCVVYQTFVAGYGEALFGSKSAGDWLADFTVLITGVMGCIMAPLSGMLADRLGLDVFLMFLCFLQVVATCTVSFASWPAQIVCTSVTTLYILLFFVFVPKLLLEYSPPHRFGTVQGVYATLVVSILLPCSTFCSGVVAVLPASVNAYRVPNQLCAILGAATMLAYVFYFRRHPPPEVPLMLAEDEIEVSKQFGCRTLEEVMELTGIPTRKELLSVLASAEPGVLQDVMSQIDADKLIDLMFKRSVEEVSLMLEDAIFGYIDLDNDHDEDEQYEEENGEDNTESECDEKEINLARHDSSAIALTEEMLANNARSLNCSPRSCSRIRRLGEHLARIVASGDKEPCKQYMLEYPIADICSVAQDMEQWLTARDRKRLRKHFRNVFPAIELTSLLQQRPELKMVMIERVIKPLLEKALASFASDH